MTPIQTTSCRLTIPAMTRDFRCACGLVWAPTQFRSQLRHIPIPPPHVLHIVHGPLLIGSLKHNPIWMCLLPELVLSYLGRELTGVTPKKKMKKGRFLKKEPRMESPNGSDSWSALPRPRLLLSPWGRDLHRPSLAALTLRMPVLQTNAHPILKNHQGFR